MKNEKPYERQFRWLLLLAFLINLLFLFFIFFMNFDTQDLLFQQPEDMQNNAPVVFDTMPEEPLPEPPPQPQELAALKPRASQFGATPLQQEEPEFSPGAYDPLIPEFMGKDEQDNEQAEQQEQEVEKNIEQKEVKEEQEAPKSEADEMQPVLFKPETKPQEAQKLQKVSTLTQGQQQKASQRNNNNGNQAKIASPIEKKLTFNDLATGFLASWQNDGNDWLERQGNENIRPDMEEMKYLSYLQKIAWYMQNAWQRQDRVMLQNAPSEVVVTHVRLTIDKLGNLKQALMVKSCGFAQLDNAVMQGIREGGPYPPLPEHFKKDIMTFDFGIKHWASNTPVNFNFRR